MKKQHPLSLPGSPSDRDLRTSERPPVGHETGTAPIPEVINLVCYDRIEIQAIEKRMKVEAARPLPDSKFPILAGTLDGWPVTALRLPFGDKPGLLRKIAQSFIEAEHPATCISLGTCMSCGPSFQAGEVAVPTAAIGAGGSPRSWDPPFLNELIDSAPHEIPIRKAVSLYSSKFIATQADLDELILTTGGGEIVEMEDFPLSEVFGKAGIPYLSIRVVTDRGNLGDHLSNLPSSSGLLVRLLRRLLRRFRSDRFLEFSAGNIDWEMPFKILVRTPGSPLTLDEAVRIARRAREIFKVGDLLSPGAIWELTIGKIPVPPGQPQAPSGKAIVACDGTNWNLTLCPSRGFLGLILDAAWFDSNPRLPQDFAPSLVRSTPREVARLSHPEPEGRIPSLGNFHVQGLNSISAEPEEGLLAATTATEFESQGLQITHSESASTWVYRTANAMEESYFEPPYDLPMRPRGAVPPGRYLIATGLGPFIDAGARGGALADTLMLGDEQAGRLIQYLDDLSRIPFSHRDVFRYPGVIQRIGADSVALSRPDLRAVLTKGGLNSLEFDPIAIRQVFSPDYDLFFRGFFSPNRRDRPPKVSHLMMTSRGCGNRCSICCSGGYQPFTGLEPGKTVEILKRIMELSRLENGEYVEIFLLDSSFNNDPESLLELVGLLRVEGLLRFFEFFVRHNGLVGFLDRRAPATAGSPRKVRSDIIAAYRELGIDEIVIGIDVYTEESIRLLKTDFRRLAETGFSTPPSYTFPEIEAVLTEIQAQGMASRCFFLGGNPFVGHHDRIRSWYRIGKLALQIPRFRIDLDSSSRVNELKPFPGAPITVVARSVPGLIAGDRFDLDATPEKLNGYHGTGDADSASNPETFLDLRILGNHRVSPESRRVFFTGFHRSRIMLAEWLQKLLVSGNDSGLASIKAFLEGEESVRPPVSVFTREFPEFEPSETVLAGIVERLRKRLPMETSGQSTSGPAADSPFFEILSRAFPPARTPR